MLPFNCVDCRNQECDPGFHGSVCNQACPTNCENNLCSMQAGKCMECDIGFYGTRCDLPCSDNCKNSVCKKETGHCEVSQNQTDAIPRAMFTNTEHVTGYAILGTLLGISICCNVGLILLFLRISRKLKLSSQPPVSYGMQTNSITDDTRNYEGLDVAKIDNTKSIYDIIKT
ncbi:N-acetylglucosamine-1-phosphodiester alpha-N-acetylglucosaminidase-like isoform X2 [Pecten maximus]|uniref:N-acetylglucosamine-1-phosphodiester alpha-N-acetylglucosaminidase-like isoform X2 n=1 Tax=Pecten maximus TaxID=6579 RepID=UPI001458EA77|nr:N-acetylglucosamine-1-phosphodiester alpha-N-acetylglucosaminidase-like isoform X2 [Pecten maximus]XP_033729617.1 N-acetylglucosamine-1-phosphodiester alpha-N-acetylglucosaminidase-like isoform X2 [Pecten maximus]